jgi:16S rRNA (adenine1518-N6/adenine1519-N6)-dimethyltransferase
LVPRRRGFPPVLKRYGQHFLNDRSALVDIADAVRLEPGDVVVEIGPGRGALTALLLARARKVIAVEIDHELSDRLQKSYEGDPRLSVIEADILDVDLSTLVDGKFSVVGNIPYNITTPILFHVLRPPFPAYAVFLVQREVAERIVAPPGSNDYGALSVNVQAIARSEIVRTVSPASFTPPPKVESAVIRISPLDSAVLPSEELHEFRIFVQSVFGMRRKQIANVLRAVGRVSLEDARGILAAHQIDPKTRPETLSPLQLAALMRATR